MGSLRVGEHIVFSIVCRSEVLWLESTRLLKVLKILSVHFDGDCVGTEISTSWELRVRWKGLDEFWSFEQSGLQSENFE